ncbi:MAG: hypothetical protein ACO1SX_24740, partial [Actinomycetota bacterium]
MDFFLDLYQERRIGEARAQAARGEARADQASMAVGSLQARFERMVLLNMALWSLVKETTGLTDEALAARVREIDLQDGHQDGQIKATVEPCPKCNKTLSKKHQRCLFCGFEPEDPNVFRG